MQTLAVRWLADNPWTALARTLVPSAVRMAGAGLQFLSTVIVARVLGDEPGAGFFFWSSVLMTSGPIATYGLEQIALRNAPRLQEQGPAAVGRFLASLRFVAALASIALGLGLIAFDVLSEKGGGGVQLWHFLPPLALASIAMTLIHGEALKGLSHPVLAVVFGHLIPVSLFCLLTVLFARNVASPGVLALYSASYLVGALAVRFCPVPGCRSPLLVRPDGRTFRTILKEGFPVCCVNLFGAMGFIVPLTLLELTRPAAEVAYITTAFRISILFIVLASAIHGVFAPALSRTALLPDPFRPLFQVYGKAVALTLVSLAPPLIAGIAFPELVMSVFGESFRNGAGALRMLLILQLVALCIGPVPHLLLMTGHTVVLARLGLLKLILGVALSALLIPSLGGVGMVAAMGIAFVAEELTGLGYALVKLGRPQPATGPAA